MTEDLYSEPLGHVLAFALHLKTTGQVRKFGLEGLTRFLGKPISANHEVKLRASGAADSLVNIERRTIMVRNIFRNIT